MLVDMFRTLSSLENQKQICWLFICFACSCPSELCLIFIGLCCTRTNHVGQLSL